MNKEIEQLANKNECLFFFNKYEGKENKVYGYYFSKDTDIDYEPLDYISKRDLGHTCLFYRDKETKTYKEV